MKHIVITGSTRGIGFGLAAAFLDQDCSVTISGRAQSDVDQAVRKLNSDHSPEKILGIACDVCYPDQLQNLWDQSKRRYKIIDIWINNAGISGPQLAVWLMPIEGQGDHRDKSAGGNVRFYDRCEGMLDQGFGALYNMEGMGSDGRMHKGLTYYGTTKYGLRYYTKSLTKETKDTPLIIGSLRPGMVITDLLTKQYEGRPEDWERDKRIFNILADRVETVAPWLAAQILDNKKSGVRISWSSRWKIMGRFLISPIYKRKVID